VRQEANPAGRIPAKYEKTEEDEETADSESDETAEPQLPAS